VSAYPCGSANRTSDQTGESCSGGADRTNLGVYERECFGRCSAVNFGKLEDWNSEGDRFLGTAYAGCTRSDRPAIRNFVEVIGRTSGVGLRTLATHLV